MPAPTAKPSPRHAPKTPKPISPEPAWDTKVATPRRGVVYLTFDDGPSPYTPAVLEILRRTGSTATFFQMGIRRRAHPELVAPVLAGGNSIGNHTLDHPDLTRLSRAGIKAELLGGPRGRCARPPFGATNAKVRSVLRKLGYRQVLWSTDTVDWSRPGQQVIIRRAIPPQVGNGSIVLMHDGGGDRSQTVAALPIIIQRLHKHGYVVRRLPEC